MRPWWRPEARDALVTSRSPCTMRKRKHARALQGCRAQPMPGHGDQPGRPGPTPDRPRRPLAARPGRPAAPSRRNERRISGRLSVRWRSWGDTTPEGGYHSYRRNGIGETPHHNRAILLPSAPLPRGAHRSRQRCESGQPARSGCPISSRIVYTIRGPRSTRRPALGPRAAVSWQGSKDLFVAKKRADSRLVIRGALFGHSMERNPDARAVRRGEGDA